MIDLEILKIGNEFLACGNLHSTRRVFSMVCLYVHGQTSQTRFYRRNALAFGANQTTWPPLWQSQRCFLFTGEEEEDMEDVDMSWSKLHSMVGNSAASVSSRRPLNKSDTWKEGAAALVVLERLNRLFCAYGGSSDWRRLTRLAVAGCNAGKEDWSISILLRFWAFGKLQLPLEFIAYVARPSLHEEDLCIGDMIALADLLTILFIF